MAAILESCVALVARLRAAGAVVDDRFAPVDLAAVIGTSATVAESLQERVQVQTSVDARFDDPRPMVAGDPEELLQVFVNLFLNAFEAMAVGGVVHVTVWSEDQTVVVCVDDDGPGISKDHIDCIFDPLFTTKAASGRGIGLAVARDIVARHCGSIRALNRIVRGARFEVRLPHWRKDA